MGKEGLKMRKTFAVICVILIGTLMACTQSTSLGITPNPILPTESPKESAIPNSPLPSINESLYSIQIAVENQRFLAVLDKNETTDALMNQLPMTLDMRDMNGNEKYYYFAKNLPTHVEKPTEIHVGDLMLYEGDCLVLFYENFNSSYSYTILGYVEDIDGLASALGSGNVKVTFSAK